MPKKTKKPHYKGEKFKIDHHSILFVQMRSQFHLTLPSNLFQNLSILPK